MSDFFPIFDFIDIFWTPWSTPQDYIWNGKIVLMGFFVSASCGMIGSFIVVRRLALMGDAISHGILPGLVLAFIVSQSKALLPMFIGACAAGMLCNFCIEWLNKKSLCIVICSKGYPETYKKNIEINNLDKIKLNNNNYLFHAGTKLENKKIYAVGGRVFNFVSLSNDFADAKNQIIHNISKLDWNAGFFRKDIGYKVIE